MKIFQTDYSRQLIKSLDVAEKTQEAISRNIQNMDTPGYVRKNTNFADELMNFRNKGLHTSDEKHITKTNLNITSENGNQGNVDMTTEMSEMAINQIKYNFSIQSLRRVYSGLKSSITGRVQ